MPLSAAPGSGSGSGSGSGEGHGSNGNALAPLSNGNPGVGVGVGVGVGGAGPLGAQRALPLLPALVRRPWRHLQRAVDALGDDPPDEALHEVRIRAKRVRYAAEAAAPVVGKSARRMAVAVAEVQGVLGDLHDADVAEDWLRQAAKSSPPSTALVAGQLISQARLERADGRRSWPKPWRAASDRKLRAWLKG
jgi:hypothetical protein